MAMKALTTAFLKWQEDQLKLEAPGKPSTWQTYRRKLKVLNRNKLIVFAKKYFGIFASHEVFMLANVPVRDTEKELNITRHQVYAKYAESTPPCHEGLQCLDSGECMLAFADDYDVDLKFAIVFLEDNS